MSAANTISETTSAVTILSDKRIEFEGRQYRLLKPKKQYQYKLDPEKKKERAVYMRSWRKTKKAEIDELYAMRARLAVVAAEPSDSK
jgi:hypothetical protein